MSWDEKVVKEVDGWEYVAPYSHLITPEYIASIEAKYPNDFVDGDGCPNYDDEVVSPASADIIAGFPLMEVMQNVYDYPPEAYMRDNRHEGAEYFISSAIYEAAYIFCLAYLKQKS